MYCHSEVRHVALTYSLGLLALFQCCCSVDLLPSFHIQYCLEALLKETQNISRKRLHTNQGLIPNRGIRIFLWGPPILLNNGH